MKRHPLLAFFLITFAITWGLGSLIIIFSPQFTALFGELNLHKPFYRAYWHLAVYGPPISAFIVIASTNGLPGIRAYLRRLVHWRIGLRWYLIVIIGITALYACDRAIYAALGGAVPPYAFKPWYLVFPSALFALVNDPGPMEELGWRGFALPLLQSKYSAFWASVILGAIWGLWHLPAFYISATPQNSFSLPLFLLGTISYATIMTVIYNATGGSILLAFLFHWQVNNPFHLNVLPDGQLISTLSFLVIAVILTIVMGPKNLGRTKHTEPVPTTTSG